MWTCWHHQRETYQVSSEAELNCQRHCWEGQANSERKSGSSAVCSLFFWRGELSAEREYCLWRGSATNVEGEIKPMAKDAFLTKQCWGRVRCGNQTEGFFKKKISQACQNFLLKNLTMLIELVSNQPFFIGNAVVQCISFVNWNRKRSWKFKLEKRPKQPVTQEVEEVLWVALWPWQSVCIYCPRINRHCSTERFGQFSYLADKLYLPQWITSCDWLI